MFWHHDVAVDPYAESPPHVFQAANKEVVCVGSAEVRLAAIATERDKVGPARLVEALQSQWA